jgi:hypothetical protein
MPAMINPRPKITPLTAAKSAVISICVDLI